MPQSVFSPKRTALAVRRSEKRAKVVPPPTTVTKKLDEELDAACVSMLDILDRDAMGQVLEASCAGDKRMPCRLGMVSKQVRDMLPSRMKDSGAAVRRKIVQVPAKITAAQRYVTQYRYVVQGTC